MSAYTDFLARKQRRDPPTGLASIPDLPDRLFPFQRDIARWALRRGRAAVFANTGLGKTFIELAWGHAVHDATGGDVLLLAPLAVAGQIVREAVKFGVPARQCAHQGEVTPGITVTNYAKLHHFDLSRFVGVILDESSILKAFDGKTRSLLINRCAGVPYRLCATATPAPNDFMELGNHAEFLGVMSLSGMQATFFTHDGGDTSKWRLIHLYLLWDAPQDAYSVRAMLADVLGALELKPGTGGVIARQVEVFPKQDEVPADGYGSMWILPGAGKSEFLGSGE